VHRIHTIHEYKKLKIEILESILLKHINEIEQFYMNAISNYSSDTTDSVHE
jgi:hypothetical protein